MVDYENNRMFYKNDMNNWNNMGEMRHPMDLPRIDENYKDFPVSIYS